MEAVTGVHEVEILTTCHPDALVHGVIDTMVRFAHPVADMGCILVYELHTAIRGTSVDDDMFEVTARLGNHTLQCLPQSFCIIVVDGDDREFHAS